MSEPLSVDDINCFLFLLVFLTCWTVQYFFPGWCYWSFAMFYRGVEKLARTRAFIILIFCCLVAKDVWNAFARAAEPWVPGPIKEFFTAVLIPQEEFHEAEYEAEYEGKQYHSPINKTLQSWIDEDASRAWRSRWTMRDGEAPGRYSLWLHRMADDSDDEDVDRNPFEADDQAETSF